MGLNDFVYPGALHTRFHHALGAMHLMSIALQNLKTKAHKISDHEYQSMLAAILLHDVGHGPFSHALETSLLSQSKHEEVSLIIMQYLDRIFEGELETCQQIFTDRYPRKFFHQLVSSQLDIDRLDYLKRDSFFTGVSEGTVGADRIIKMLDIVDDQLVVEEKGIYSIENFLHARRSMYWQVYLHKTSVAAEQMMVQLMHRARELTREGHQLNCSRQLSLFLENDITSDQLLEREEYLQAFCQLDDYDIWAAVKHWQDHQDQVLSAISNMFLNRELFQIQLQSKPFEPEVVSKLKERVKVHYNLDNHTVDYLAGHGTVSNAAYTSGDTGINILTKSGCVVDIAKASDLPSITALSKIVKKYYLCWPKSVNL